MFEEISCVGADNITRIFKYSENISPLTDSINYHVYVLDGSCHDFFELSIRNICENKYQIMVMNHQYLECYSKKGIPESLIEHLSRTKKITIQSSPTRSETGDYWRIPQATKVWERLVAKNIALYDKESDVYYTT